MFKTIASVTLTGSLLSCVATSLVLISFAFYRRHQLHNFRHVLILNLTAAEFINSLNNSISGIIYLRTGALQPGTSCVANGFIGQLSVQASDFSILAIALVTLFTVTRKTYMPTASFRSKFIICGSVWLIPLITSLVATIMGQMKPVGGNWCWISATRTDLRYALTHGWRFFVIFSTIITYIFIWFYLKKNLISASSYINDRKSLGESPHGFKAGGSNLSGRGRRGSGFHVMQDKEVELSDLSDVRREEPSQERPNISRRDSFTVEISIQDPDQDQDHRSATTGTGDEDQLVDSDSDLEQGIFAPHGRKESIHFQRKESMQFQRKESVHFQRKESLHFQRKESVHFHQPATLIKSTAVFQPKEDPNALSKTVSKAVQNSKAGSNTNASEFPMRHTSQQIHREIRKMMVLNAYPIMYVILWIPQLVNRLMEASGTKLPPKTSAALSASTQFVGLANSLTYGFNHHLRDRLLTTYFGPILKKIERKMRWGAK